MLLADIPAEIQISGGYIEQYLPQTFITIMLWNSILDINN